jgi:Holliday junction resolvasome RuvABC endonuclease subunit
MNLIGMDIGFRATGVSHFEVWNQNGKVRLNFISGIVIVTAKDKDKKNARVSDTDVQACKHIVKALDDYMETNQIKRQKSFCACEFPTGGARGARANRTMGMATGLLIGYLESQKIFIIETVTPKEVKIAATENSKASKNEVIKAIMKKRAIYKHRKYINKIIHKNLMEHFCDSIGAAIHVVKHSDLFKLHMER